MSVPFRMSVKDYKRVHGGDGRDTPFLGKQSVVLTHGMSPELMVGGPRFVRNAKIGSWVVPQGDARVPFDGETGFVAQIIGFDLSHPEYTVGIGDDRGVFVCDHGRQAPKDMKFLYAADGRVKKSGHYRVEIDGQPGNKVVPTIGVSMVVNGYGVVYDAYGTAFAPTKELVIRAERLRVKVEVDGKAEQLRGCTLGKFRFTSRFEKKAYTYPVPVMTLIGKLGEADGPTIEEWRLALDLRQAFKEGLDWVPNEALDVPAPPAEALPPPSSSSPKLTTTINDVVTEVNPPPPGGEEDYGFDDEIRW